MKAEALLLVGTGGFLGSVARYMLTLMFSPLAPGFPFATFAVNILGSFLIDYLVACEGSDMGFSRWICAY